MILVPNLILLVYFLVSYTLDYSLVYSAIGYLVFGVIGNMIGFHRLFTHVSFTPKKGVASLLLYLGSLSGQGSSIFWSSLHSHHHKNADTYKDLHTPSRGYFNAFIGWQFFCKKELAELLPRKNLVASTLHRNFHRHYYLIYWASFFVVALSFGLDVAVALITIGGYFITSLTDNLGNLFLHSNVGYRNYDLSDNSRNNHFISLLTLGSGYHNNHHAFPSKSTFKAKDNEIDLCGILIDKVLKKYEKL